MLRQLFGGRFGGTGKFLTSDLHDYKGIKVSGSHMVKEDGTWMRVRDTKHGKSLGDDEVKVYVFGTENRRILIKDTLFTDYFDGFEQQGLETLGEKYFGQWREHAQNSIGLVDKQVVDFTGK